MTKKSLLFISVAAAAGAAAAFRRRAADVRYQADREAANCERLLQKIGAQTVSLR